MTTYSPPIELRPVCSSDKSPRIEKSPISFGDVSPSTPFDIRSMPPPDKCSTTFTTSPNQQLTSSLSISSDKLISLDTPPPQQTPTAVNNQPLLFDLTTHKNHLSNAMNDQFIDGNGNGNGQIDKNNSNNNHHSSNTSNGTAIYQIPLYLFIMNIEIKRKHSILNRFVIQLQVLSIQ